MLTLDRGQIQIANREKDVEFCVINEEFSKYDELFLKNAFKKRGMDLAYDSAEGQYVVSKGVIVSKPSDFLLT